VSIYKEDAMTQFFSLENKAAVVTGGTSGIGLSTAKRLIEAGAKVVIAGRKDGTEVANEIGAHFVQCDVSKEEDVKNLMRQTHEKLGKLNIIVNCAGVNAGYNILMDSEKKHFDFNYSINTMGVVYGIKYGVPLMNEGGSIINVSSAAGLQGAAYLAPYVASKWAVVGITRTAALELGDKNIRVNVICPTSVNTPMAHAAGGEAQMAMEHKAVPMGRIAEPEEIAAVVHFLAADDCSFINGQAIAVDGGFTAGMSIRAYNTLAAE
jgi:NAD(P)-dependent dehydrogenase (short-subunit alcohol dehydrogenase family)